MLFLDSSIIQTLGAETIEIQSNGPSLFEILIPEGYLLKSIVTLLLITLVLAAWKAPNRVKEIGLLSLAFGFLWTVVGLIFHANHLEEGREFPAVNVVWAGWRSWLRPVVYSIIVYIVSLIIRIISHISNRSVRRWVKGFGLLALALGLLWIPIGLIRTSNIMEVWGDARPSVIYMGVKQSLIPFACSLIVYIITLIIRIAIKPRKQTSN